jgi:DNA-binding SARP family transcriptional activator/tetratricopeptide (TPR) repeat protein
MVRVCSHQVPALLHSPDMTGRVTVELLGDFLVRRVDGAVADHWTRPTAKRLFSLLLLTPTRTLGREEAAEVLFPGLRAARRANALAKAVVWCREAVGEGPGHALVAHGGRLRWEGATQVDVDVVFRLTRGGGVPSPAVLQQLADDHRELLRGWDDAWLGPFRDEVGQARRAARVSLAQSLERGSHLDIEEASRRWRGLVEDDPLDESHQAGLIRTLLLLGRRDAAREAYIACRRTLWNELRVEPGATLESLWRHGPGTATPAPAQLRHDDAPAVNRGPEEDAWLLPGRAGLLADLDRRLARAEAAGGCCAAVVAEAGAGKSAVLAAVADRWRSRGWRVVEGSRPRATAGYGTIGGALRELVRGTAEEPLVDALVSARPSSAVPDTAPETSERALHARLARAIEAGAAVPTLLVVDDLHDADGATVRLLNGLAANTQGRHWSLLVASRPAGQQGGLATDQPWDSASFSLDPLPDPIIDRIVRSRCADRTEEELGLAVTRARGNPLFAEEIAQLLSTGAAATAIPPSAVGLLRQRLSRLPREQRALIPMLVLAGNDASWPLVSLATRHLDRENGAGPLRQVIESLTRSGLVEERGDVLTPVHPLIGEAALALLSRGERAALHDLLARLMSRTDNDVAASRHRLAAFDALPEPTRAKGAVPAAVIAAQRALEQGANVEAADLARCALRAWVVCDPHVREQLQPAFLDAHLILGHALASLRPAEAAATYDNGARHAPDDDGRARFLVAKGWLHYSHGEHSLAARVYQEGLDLPDLSPATRATLSTGLGWVLARQGLFDRGLELIDAALGPVTADTHPETVALGLDRKGMTLAFMGRSVEALAVLDLAYETGTRVGQPSLLAAIQAHRGNVSGRLGNWDPALRYLDDAVHLARRGNDPYVESVAWWSLTDVLSRKGDLAGALAANREEERALRLAVNQAHLSACLRRRAGLLDPSHRTTATQGGTTP